MRLFALTALLSIAACGGESPTPAAEPAAEPAPAPAAEPAAEPAAAPTAADGLTHVDLNNATEVEFKTAIPGLSDRMVHEFEEYRPYVSIAQFRREMSKYVDDATIAGYEEHVYVPINVNECDRATIAQLPGISEEQAGELVEGRPYADVDAFASAVEKYESPAAIKAAREWTVW